MTSRWWQLLVGVVLAGTAGAAWAQPGRMDEGAEDKLQKSHDLSHLPRFAGDPESLLKQRGLSKQPADIAERLKKLGIKPEDAERLLKDPEGLRKLLKDFNLDPNDKSLPDSVRQMLKGFNLAGAADQLTDEKIKEIRESLNKKAGAADAQPTPGAGMPQSPGHVPPMMPRPGMAQAQVSGTQPNERPGSRDEQGDSAEQDRANQPPPSALTRGLLNAAERLKKLDPSLSRSPALNRAIRELSRHVGEEDPRWPKLVNGANALQERLTGLGQTLHLDRVWPKNGLAWPKALTPSSVPRLHISTGPLERPSLGELPRMGSPAAPGADGWRGLVGVAGLMVFGFLLWRFLGRTADAEAQAGKAGWKLGPWPVQPAAVRTREELIRAFEYLSLLCLGPQARHWNHRVIAGQLGETATNPAPPRRVPSGGLPLLIGPDASERRHAAEELAALYEQARYAPPQDVLPVEALADARRDLCLLAGVAAV